MLEYFLKKFICLSQKTSEVISLVSSAKAAIPVLVLGRDVIAPHAGRRRVHLEFLEIVWEAVSVCKPFFVFHVDRVRAHAGIVEGYVVHVPEVLVAPFHRNGPAAVPSIYVVGADARR
mgnify:CR=1 FL=1